VSQLLNNLPFVRKHGWPKVILFCLDVIAILLAVVSTFFLHYFTGFDDYNLEGSLDEYIQRVSFFFLSLPILILLFRHNFLYKFKLYSTGSAQLAFIIRSILINALLLIAILFFVRKEWIMHSRANLILFSITAFLYFALFRVLIFRKFILKQVAGLSLRKVLLIGGGEIAKSLLELPLNISHVPYRIVAVVDPHAAARNPLLENPPLVLREIPALEPFLTQHSIEEVIIADNALEYDEVVKVLTACRNHGVIVNLLSDQFKVIHDHVTKANSEFANISTAPVIYGPEGFYGAYMKRLFDILFTCLILLLISPFLFVISLFIKLTSKGPIIYKTRVVGQCSKEFTWYKFRTMRTDAGDVIHQKHVSEHIKLGNRPTAKLANDPRVTTIGKWLRRHSLDELPQLFNVLKGDMSLVGPRPCLPYEFEQYQEWHKERFIVRPGLSGLWQVSGRSSVSFNDMIILDLYYIHNLSFWLDATIIIKTVGVVLTGKGGG